MQALSNTNVWNMDTICHDGGRPLADDEATPLTDYISSELAAIWNITRDNPNQSAAAIG